MLDELCVQVRQALETWADEDSEQRDGLLQQAIEDCEKVHGSLSVLNFESGQLMAKAMQDALLALKNDTTEHKEAVQTVLEATAILPDYLDYIESSESDQIGLILPVINDLRVTAGQKALDKAEFFPVELSDIRPPPEAADGSIGFSQLRRDFQAALRDYLKLQSDEALSDLTRVLLQIRNHPLLPNGVRRMAWALAGLAELIQVDQYKFSPDISRHFSRLDNLLKEVCSEADELAIDARANSAVRAVLYLVAMAQSDTPQTKALREAFDFDSALAAPEMEASIFLAGQSRELFQAVTGAAKEDLTRIKEVLGSQLESDRDPAVLEQQRELLRSVGESLGMIGLHKLGKRIENQADRLADVGTGTDDPVLLQIARELIVAESGLSDGFLSAALMREDPDDEADLPGTLLPASEYRRILHQLSQECKEDLAHVQHLLDTLSRNKTGREAATDARQLLSRISSALRVAEISVVADLLDAAGQVVEAEFMGDSYQPDPTATTVLAETLTAIELHLQDLTDGGETSAFAPIMQAQRDLRMLGYLDTTEAKADAPQAPEAEAQRSEPSDPADLELADLEPADLEPADLEPADLEPADLEPADLEPSDLEPSDLEPADLEPADLEPSELEPADPEPSDLEPEPTAEDSLKLDDDDRTTAADDAQIAGSFDAEIDGEPDLPDKISEEPSEILGEETESEEGHAFNAPAEAEEAPAETTRESSEDEPQKEAGEAPALSSEADEDFDIAEIFLEEFDHELTTLGKLLADWKSRPGNLELLGSIRRSFHSLKGSGRMAGAEEIAEFSWKFEHLLNRHIDGDLTVDDDLEELLGAGIAALPSLRTRFAATGPGELDTDACQRLAQQAADMAEGRAVVDPPRPSEMAELDDTLVELMTKELSDHLDTLTTWVDDANAWGVPGQIEKELVRAVHTIKGTMRMAPIGDESETTQILESYLDELALCHAAPSSEGQSAIEECVALFKNRLDRLELKPVPDERFQTAALGQQLSELHERAHQKRMGESADFSTDAPAIDTGPGEVEQFSSEIPPDQSRSIIDLVSRFFSLPNALKRDNAPPTEVVSDPEPEASPEFRGETEAKPDPEAEPKPEAESAPKAWLETGTERASESERQAAPAPTADKAVEPDVFLEPTAELPDPEKPLTEDGAEHDIGTEPGSRSEAGIPSSGDSRRIAYADLDEELLDAFLEEATEILEHSDELLQQWQESVEDKNVVFALQRDLHTLKGSARMVGLEPIGQIAHAMEELLENIAAGRQEASDERINALEAGCDHLNDMVDAVLRRADLPIKTLDDLFAEQVAEIGEASTLAIEDVETSIVQEEPEASHRTESLRVGANLIDDLVNQAGEVSIFRSRLEQRLTQIRGNINEVDETVARLRNQLRKLEIETEAQILARFEREHGPAEGDFDPLELDRYSTIQQLSRALAESVNDLTSLTGLLDEGARQSETLLLQQSRVNTELQEGLMQARMVSFTTLLPRFRRVVRNAAREMERQVQLDVELEGEGELDRNVLDRMTAPIEHLLRNAVSHGIEPAESRRQAGKDPVGKIRIAVGREATELVIRVSDDGRGLDLEQIRQRAIERNLIAAGASLSQDELAKLIFASGLTTIDQVSELAGRGIGMNVVADSVRQIGGSILIDNTEGRGITFTIRIPLSLTVLQAIHVRAGDREFTIPLQVIRGVVRLPAQEWLEHLEEEEPARDYAGQRFPLLELEPQLDFELEEPQSGTLNLLMIEVGDQRAGLKVSELLGHREIVIKPVGPQISSIPGILGATIAGDGQVIPILDMGPLIRRAFARGLVPGAGRVSDADEQPETKRTPLIMVVDDSITVRRVTARVLEQNGYEVLTARDGLDAVEALVDRIPDLILLDIEMPRMDGYQLASHIRNDRRLKHIPMIMITSRSGEKHRDRAMQIGVDDYMTKPYNETNLTNRIAAQLEKRRAGEST